jgi:ubiquinone/menaquinone biosynthesis C-methylase UbiE
MIKQKHRLSELITMYKGLVQMYDEAANQRSALLSDYITEQNMLRALDSLDIKKVLDAGGGTGRWSAFLARQGYEVTLMDISPDMLQMAVEKFKKAKLNVTIVEGNIENTPFEEDAFDLVLAEGGVISITPNPQKMLAEFRRITKSGGYVWIDYLNVLGWSMLQPEVDLKMQLAAVEEEEIYLGKNEFPFRMFQPHRIRHMLYDCGFMELNEFGNGILTNPMMGDDKLEGTDLGLLSKLELSLSRNYSLVGSAFHVEVLAQKVIH